MVNYKKETPEDVKKCEEAIAKLSGKPSETITTFFNSLVVHNPINSKVLKGENLKGDIMIEEIVKNIEAKGEDEIFNLGGVELNQYSEFVINSQRVWEESYNCFEKFLIEKKYNSFPSIIDDDKIRRLIVFPVNAEMPDDVSREELMQVKESKDLLKVVGFKPNNHIVLSYCWNGVNKILYYKKPNKVFFIKV